MKDYVINHRIPGCFGVIEGRLRVDIRWVQGCNEVGSDSNFLAPTVHILYSVYTITILYHTIP